MSPEDGLLMLFMVMCVGALVGLLVYFYSDY